jgi:UDP-glucose 4-epimerase
MTILVTGGAGYIGTHICVELLEAGHDVVVADNFANSDPEALRRVEQLTGKTIQEFSIDMTDAAALDAVFDRTPIDAAIHLAGLKAVGESVAEPLYYYQNNLGATLNLCASMARHNVSKMVFSSSATVYGSPETVPVKEDAPLGATNPYGRTKLMGEEILQDICVANPDWSICLLRYFNPVGAHPSGRIGESPRGVPGNLMPFIAQVATGQRPSLKVLGDDYNTPDGTGVRDYIHVVDLAKGHLMALEHLESTTGAHAYNLGTGHGLSVLEVLAEFRRASGKEIPYEIVARRPGDVAACYADVSKANAELGWRAERGLEEMCADSWRWQSANPNGYEQA